MKNLPAEASTDIIINSYELASLREKVDSIFKYYDAGGYRSLSDKEFQRVTDVPVEVRT